MNIISGSGLGLFDRNMMQTMNGDEHILVNAATGNLIHQYSDALILGKGFDNHLFRTYNSQGIINDDNHDRFRFNINRRVFNLIGDIATENSSIQRVEGDGHVATFIWHAERNLYLSTEGADAHDILQYDDNTHQWIYTEGSTRQQDIYDWRDLNGRLIQERDVEGNRLNFLYHANGFANKISDSLGNALLIDYNDKGQAIAVQQSINGLHQQKQSFHYDEQGRLQRVKLDLTPDDASDTLTFETLYGYEGSSHLLTSIQQSNGLQLTISYITLNGVNRVAEVIQGSPQESSATVTAFHYEMLASGESKTTIVQKNAASTIDSVLMQWFDEEQNLIKQQNGQGAQALIETYDYDNEGNLISIIDASGGITKLHYENGLLVRRDDMGAISEWHYDESHQLIREDNYNQLSSASGHLDSKQSIHYVYDDISRLRFVIDALGHVKETRYSDTLTRLTQTTSQILYLGQTFEISTQDIQLSMLEDWVSQADLQQTQRIDSIENFEKRIVSERQYKAVSSNGEGIQETAMIVDYHYDAQGNLIQSLEKTEEGWSQSAWLYDGLGRTIKITDAKGNVTIMEYHDASQQVMTTFANGRIETSLMDTQGRIVSQTQTSNLQEEGELLSASYFNYDALSLLYRIVNVDGEQTRLIYDDKKRLIGEVDAQGYYIESIYDKHDRVIKTIQYATPLQNNRPQLTIHDKPMASGEDRHTHYFYDLWDRLQFEVNAQGYVTEFDYNAQGWLLGTYQYSQPFLTSSDEASNTEALQQFVQKLIESSTDKDETPLTVRRQNFFYDANGQVIGELDAENFLTTFTYNTAGQVVQQTQYATRATPQDLQHFNADELASLIPLEDPKDRREQWLYNSADQKIAYVSGEGYLKTYEYDARGNLIQASHFNQYNQQLTSALLDKNNLSAWLSHVGLSSESLHFEYNILGQLTAETHVDGSITRYEYNAMGELIQQKSYTQNRQLDYRLEYTRDVLGQVEKEQEFFRHSDDEALQAGGVVDTVYDRRGHNIAQISADGGLSWSIYNARGLMTHHVHWRNHQGVLKADVTLMEYDAFQSLTRLKNYAQVLDETTIQTTLNTHLSLQDLTLQLTSSQLQQLLPTIDIKLQSAVSRDQTFDYDLLGQIIRQTDSDGEKSELAYDSFGQLAYHAQAVKGQALWQVQSYQYNLRGEQTQHQRFYDYIDDTALLHVLSPDSNTLSATHHSTQYNAFGEAEVIRMEAEASPYATLLEYNQEGQVIRKTVDPDGLQLFTAYLYDGAGRLIREDRGGRDQIYDHETRQVILNELRTLSSCVYFYNDQGQVIKEGKVSPQRIDVSLDTPLEEIVVYQYDDKGRLAQEQIAGGSHTYFHYDGKDRLVRKFVKQGALDTNHTHPIIASMTQYAYGKAGNIVRTSLAQEVVHLNEEGVLLEEASSIRQSHTYQVYNEQGNVFLAVDALGFVTQWYYDERGNRVASTEYAHANEALVNELAMQLDAKQSFNPQSIFEKINAAAQQADDRTQYWAYNQRNQVVLHIDAEGYIQRNDYNEQNLLSQTTQYGEEEKIALFNFLAKNHVHPSQLHSVLSEVLTHLEHSASAEAIEQFYFYDGAGRLRLSIDGDGYAQVLSYNSLDLVMEKAQLADQLDRQLINTLQKQRDTLEVSIDSLLTRTIRQESFTYDASLRVSQHKDASDTLSLTTYDALNRTTFAAQNIQEIVSTENDNTISHRFLGAPDRIAYMIDKDNYIYRIHWQGEGKEIADIAAIEKSKEALSAGDLSVLESYYDYFIAIEDFASIRDYVFVSFDSVFVSDRVYNNPLDFARLIDGTVMSSQIDLSQGRHQSYHYDGFGRLTQTQTAHSMVSDKYHYTHTQHVYDEYGRMIETTNANGHATYFYYDAAGRQTHVVTRLVVKGNQQGSEENRYEVSALHYDRSTQQLIQRINYRDTFVLNNITGGDVKPLLQQLAAQDLKADIQYFEYDDRRQLIRERFGNRQVNYVYNAQGQQVQSSRITLPDDGVTASGETEQSITVYEYDRRGLLVREQHQAKIIDDQLIESVMSLKTNQHDYDAFGRVIAIHNGENETQSIGYNKRHQKNLLINTNGATVTHQYNAFGELQQTTDALGHRLLYQYDIKQRQVTRLAILADGTTQLELQTQRNAFGEVIHVKDAKQQLTTYEYDLQGNLLRTIERDINQNILREQHSRYDHLGQVLSQKILVDGQIGREHRWVYDEKNRVIKESHGGTDGQLISEKSFQYDGANHIIQSQSETGVITRHVLDERGNTLWLLTNLESSTHFKRFYYNADNQVVRVEEGELPGISAQANDTQKETHTITTFAYDAVGQRLAEKSLDINDETKILTASYFSYDHAGRLIKQTDGNGYQDEWVYNQQGEKTWHIDSEGRVTRALFNAAGQIIAQVSYAQRLGDEQRATVSHENLLTSFAELQLEDRVTLYYYNKKGLLIYQVDANASLHSFQYDVLEQLTHHTQHAARIDWPLEGDIATLWLRVEVQLNALTQTHDDNDRRELTFYDALGRLSYQVGVNGKVMAYQYNDWDQIIGRRDYASTVNVFAIENQGALLAALQAAIVAEGTVNDSRQEFYYYNALGQRRVVIDALGGVTEFHYDATNRETGSTGYNRLFTGATGGESIESVLAVVRQGQSRTERVVYDALGRERFHIHSYQTMDELSNTLILVGDVIETRYSHEDMGERDGELMTWERVDTRSYAEPILLESVTWDTPETLKLLMQAVANKTLISRQVTHLDTVGHVRESIDFQQANAMLQEQAVTRMLYDHNGNLIQRTKADGFNQYYFYNNENQLIAQFDVANILEGEEQGYWKSYDYNAFGEIQEERRWLEKMTFSAPMPINNDSMTQVYRYAYNAMGQLSQEAIFSANGILEQANLYQYNSFGNKISQQQLIHTPQPVTWQNFDALMAASADMQWHETQYAYDKKDRILQVQTDWQDPSQSIRYYYNVWGEQVAIHHGSGQILVSEYNARGLKIEEKRGYLKPNHETALTLTQLLDEIRLNDFALQKSATIHNGFGDVLLTTQAGTDSNGQMRFFYNHRGQIELQIDGEGYVTEFFYDSNGVLTFSRRWGTSLAVVDMTDIQRHWVEAQIETWLIDVSVTAQLRRHEVDGLGRITAVYVNMAQSPEQTAAMTEAQLKNRFDQTQANQMLSSHAYDAMGRILASMDENGLTTYYTYDGRGNTQSESVTLAEVDADGLATYTKVHYYDHNNQLTLSQWQDDSVAAVSRYNVSGQITERTDAFGVKTRFVYNLRGQLISTSNQATNANQYFFYNRQGQQVLHVDALGNLHLSVYDTAGNQVGSKTLDVRIDLTPAQIDALRLALMEDVGRVSLDHSDEQYSAQFTEMSRLIGRLTDRLTQSLHEFDSNELKPAGRETYRVFDALNRQVASATQAVTGYSLSGGWSEAASLVETRHYSQFDSGTRVIITAADGAETHEYYNARGELIIKLLMEKASSESLTKFQASVKSFQAIGYRYDAFGNKISETLFAQAARSHATHFNDLTLAHRDDRTTHYVYDAQNRLTHSYQDKAVFYRDAKGQQLPPNVKIVSEQIVTEYRYADQTSTHSVEERRYQRARPRVDANTWLIEGEVQFIQRGFDALGRVIEEHRWEQDSLADNANKSFASLKTTRTYDRFDNQRSETLTNESQQIKAQIMSYDRERLISSEGYQGHVLYQYDEAGRLQQRTTIFENFNAQSNIWEQQQLKTTYTYDAANRILSTSYSDSTDPAYIKKLYTEINEYNTYGELTQVKRYGTLNNAGKTWDYDNKIVMARYHYDQAGRKVQVQEEGITHRFAYDAAGNVTLQLTLQQGSVDKELGLSDLLNADNNGRQWLLNLFDYDQGQRITRQRHIDIKDSTLRNVLERQREQSASEELDNDGAWIMQRFQFNRFGELIKHWDLGGNLTQYQYNHAGWVSEKINAAAQRTLTDYDARSRVVRELTADETAQISSQRFYYDVFGRVIEVLDEMGNRKTKDWDFDQLIVERHFLHADPADATPNDTYFKANVYRYNGFGDLVYQARQGAQGIRDAYPDIWQEHYHHYSYLPSSQGTAGALVERTSYQNVNLGSDNHDRFLNAFVTLTDSAGRLLERRAYINKLQSENVSDFNQQDWFAQSQNLREIETYGYDVWGQLSQIARYGSMADQQVGIQNAHFLQTTQHHVFWRNLSAATEGETELTINQVLSKRVNEIRQGETLRRETITVNAQGQTITQVNENMASDSGHNTLLFSETHQQEYNAQGQVIAIKAANGQLQKTFDYDAYGRLIHMKNYVNGELYGGSQELYGYDERGLRTEEISIMAFGTDKETRRYKEASYNSRGWLSAVSMYAQPKIEGQARDALWSVSREYDTLGNITVQTLKQPGQAHQRNRFVFDSYQRIIAREQNNETQRILYDTLDRATQISNYSDNNEQSVSSVQHRYRADGKVKSTLVRQGDQEHTQYYVYDDEPRFNAQGKLMVDAEFNDALGLPVSLLQEHIGPAQFTGHGHLLLTIDGERDFKENAVQSVRRLSFNQHNRDNGRLTGSIVYEYDDSTNIINSHNDYDAWGNLTRTEMSIKTPGSDTYTRITTDYHYRDVTTGKKSQIRVDGTLVYTGDDEDVRAFLDAGINDLWDEAISRLDYGTDPHNHDIQSVKKYQVQRDIDQDVFADILYYTQLAENDPEFKALSKKDRQDPDSEGYKNAINTKRKRRLQEAFAKVTVATDHNHYQYNAMSQITQRDQQQLIDDRTNTKTDYFYFNGQVLAHQVDNGAVILASPHVNQINDNLLSKTTSTAYRAQRGDTLQTIAARFYGDSSLWYLIAESNGLSANTSLLAGQNIIIPEVMQSAYFNSSVQTTYDWGERIGNINPSLPNMPEIPDAPPPPPPPPTNQCEQIVSILVVVVIAVVSAVAVAALTAVTGPIGAVVGGVLIGAVEGAVSQVAVQGVQMAFGSREAGDFDGAAIAEGAIMGGVAGGFSGGMASFGKIAARATQKLAKNGAKLSHKERLAYSLSKTTGNLTSGQKFTGNLAFGAVMGTATDVAGQGFRMALDNQREFDWVRFGASVFASSASVGISGVRGEAGLLREGEALSKGALASASKRFAINATLHAGVSMTSSIGQQIAYGQSLKNMQWGVVAVQAMADGFTEATTDRITQKFDNIGAINPMLYQSSSFKQRLSMLGHQLRGKGNAKQNMQLIAQREQAIFAAFSKMPSESVRSKILDNLQAQMAKVKPMQLSRALDVLPARIASDPAAWLNSLTHAGSTSKNAASINAAKRTEDVDNALSPNCFAAGTLIHTESGLVPIEQINKTHRILTRNDKDSSGELTYRPILEHFVNPNKEVVAITFSDGHGKTETIISTAGHPYYVHEKGWVDAIDLAENDVLLDINNQALHVITKTEFDDTMTVYNFEVPVDHTYFVGELGIWTHNVNCYEEKVSDRQPDVATHVYELDEEKKQSLLNNGLTGRYRRIESVDVEMSHVNPPTRTNIADRKFNAPEETTKKTLKEATPTSKERAKTILQEATGQSNNADYQRLLESSKITGTNQQGLYPDKLDKVDFTNPDYSSNRTTQMLAALSRLSIAWFEDKGHSHPVEVQFGIKNDRNANELFVSSNKREGQEQLETMIKELPDFMRQKLRDSTGAFEKESELADIVRILDFSEQQTRRGETGTDDDAVAKNLLSIFFGNKQDGTIKIAKITDESFERHAEQVVAKAMDEFYTDHDPEVIIAGHKYRCLGCASSLGDGHINGNGQYLSGKMFMNEADQAKFVDRLAEPRQVVSAVRKRSKSIDGIEWVRTAFADAERQRIEKQAEFTNNWREWFSLDARSERKRELKVERSRINKEWDDAIASSRLFREMLGNH
ncbi:MAG: polymorphic toxin-type HINT domain-containing protein [Pseudomonadota bacterium]